MSLTETENGGAGMNEPAAALHRLANPDLQQVMTGKLLPIYVVIGTRAQLIKMAPVMRELEKAGLPYDFVYTQQHKETIEDLIANFDITTRPRPVIQCSQEAKTLWLFAGWWAGMLRVMLSSRRRAMVFSRGAGLVVTHGDTATTLWAAVCGKLSGCVVMHVEAGLRSHNLLDPFPEEIMRVLTGRFADIHACPNDWAVQNLRNVKGVKLNTVQNLMRDSLAYGLEKVKDNPAYASRLRELGVPDEFALVSIHRYENIFRRMRLQKVMSLLLRIAGRISLVIVMHPSTERQLVRTGWREKLAANPRIVLLPRQDFMTFVALVQRARFVVTDGGSNQEEMSYIGKPTLIFRMVTERREGIGRNAVISRFDEAVIDDFVADYRKYEYPPQQTEASPARMLVDWIGKFVRRGSLANSESVNRTGPVA